MTSLELIGVLFKKKNQRVGRQFWHWSIQSCPGKVSVLKASPIRESLGKSPSVLSSPESEGGSHSTVSFILCLSTNCHSDLDSLTLEQTCLTISHLWVDCLQLPYFKKSGRKMKIDFSQNSKSILVFLLFWIVFLWANIFHEPEACLFYTRLVTRKPLVTLLLLFCHIPQTMGYRHIWIFKPGLWVSNWSTHAGIASTPIHWATSQATVRVFCCL